ncbi:MAG: coproporphyrinogen dehydrogenase HemZ [Lachnospiraceae bacterium]|nr:coproporphyrinogen dehydrogenase HemZ [Lachnospiraceae bacterium]
MKLDLKPDRIKVNAGENFRGIGKFDNFSETPEGCYKNEGVPDRRMYRNHLHRLVYKVLSELTGKTLPWGTLTGVRPTKQALEMERLGYDHNQIVTYFGNEYLASERKANLAVKVTENERRLLAGMSFEDTYSLYVGVPFCPSICLYCSFSSYPLKQYATSVEAYVSALLKEIEETAKLFENKKLVSIYFGGGTPTTLSAEQLETIIKKIKSCFNLDHLKEWTVEAGRPDSITREKLETLKRLGVNRISVNPQTMKQETLDLIGRRHTVEETVEAFKLARETGFDNINMDLIAGLNGETIDDFKYTLSELQKLNPDSITVHTLAVKRAARLNEKMDEYGASMSKDAALMTDYAEKFMEENGYEPYYLYRQKNMSDNLENIGYARPGKEGLYNVLIMEECHTIAACGPGASSKLVRTDEEYGAGFLNEAQDGEYVVRKIERCENVKSVKDYIERIDEMIERKHKLFLGE